jgi:adhesin transport system membrane fusion protein
MSQRQFPSTLHIIAISTAVFLLWSTLFEIDQTVRAQGQLIPAAHTQIIQAVDGGVLAAIRVQEGDLVKAGQVLAVLEPDRAKAAFDESEARMLALKASQVRAQAEATGTKPQFSKEFAAYPDLVSAQLQLYAQRKHGLEDGLAGLKESLAFAQSELKINETLSASGDISQLELLRARRQVSEIESRISDLRNKYLQEARAEAAKQEDELSSQRYRQAERRNVLEHTELTSPLDGVVKFLRFNTVGGVLRGGDEIMQISPTDGELLLELRINPSDIGLLHPGLPASVRLDTFDYTVYGVVTGELVYISSDTLSDTSPNGQSQTYYRGRVRLNAKSLADNPKLKHVAIKPGMTATVDIRTGQRSVWKYLIKPIARGFGGAMNER